MGRPADTLAPAPPTATTAGEPPVISARGIRKSFRVGDRTLEILHGVDVDLARGERVALVGQSGAGKSTLLHVLGLLERPTEGTVTVQGREAWGLPVATRAEIRNREIGFVFQFYHLLPELTAVENAVLPAMIADSRLAFARRRSEYLDRARDMLVRFGMGERLKHRPSQLSGGERQRVAMARALFQDPSILLADEPTGNLDSATGARVLDLLLEEQERRNLSLILVTHDERIAARCQRTLVMGDGKVAPG